MKRTIGMLALALSALTALGEPMSKSVPKGWGEDVAAARARAEKENKKILMAFSGSDWCGWCMKMEKDVFSKPEFIREATNRFVLVMIDNPSDKSILSKLARAQNEGLTRQYGIRGFPTTIVTDAKGKELKRFSGYRPTPQDTLNELK